MPRIGTRHIPIFFKPPQVLQTEIDKIITHYNAGLPLADIIRRVQLTRDERDGKCLSYVDVYTILYQALRAKQVIQRDGPIGEMPIVDFVDYIKRMREGGTAAECEACVSVEGRRRTSRIFFTRLFRTITDRHREYREQEKLKLSGAEILQRESDLSRQLLSKFKRLSIKQPVDPITKLASPARPAIILYLDELDKATINDIYALGTDYSRDMAIMLNDGMVPDLVSAPAGSSPTPLPPKPLSTKAPFPEFDPHELPPPRQYAQPAQPQPFEGPEDDEELDTLTQADLEADAESAEIEAQLGKYVEPQTSPLTFPSAHKEESDLPSGTSGLDLHNLGDDDEAEATPR